jgi:hypothetical protein
MGKFGSFLILISTTVDANLRLHIHLMTVSEVDEQVGRLAETLRLLRSRRNELAPISVLAPEILLGIFTHLPKLAFPVKSRRRYGRRYHSQAVFDQLHVTQVCRSWRRLTIQSPTLWNSVSFHCHPLLTEDLLRRSQGAPLDIKLDSYYSRISRSSPVIPAAFANPTRIRTIDISGDNELFDRILPSLRQPSWPVLEELRLSCYGPDYEISNPFSNAAVPNLRRLSLYCIRFSLHSHLFDHLTSLHLKNSHYEEDIAEISRRPSWPELKSVLLRPTHLQELHLVHYLPHGWPVDDEHELICLSALHTIYLEDESSRVMQFLACMSMPSLKHGQFILSSQGDAHPFENPQDGEHRRDEGHRMLAVAAALNSHLQAYPSLQVRHADFGLPSMVFRAWSPERSDESEIDLKIDYSCIGTPSFFDHFDFVHTLLSLPSFGDVTNFSIKPTLPSATQPSRSGADWTRIADFRSFFRILPHVRTFQIDSHFSGLGYGRIYRVSSIGALLHALGANNGVDPVPYPDLQELILKIFDFRPVLNPGAQHLDTSREPDVITDLLSSRADAGFPLNRLRIEQCTEVSEVMVERWRSMAEVVWDGPVHISPEDDGLLDW